MRGISVKIFEKFRQSRTKTIETNYIETQIPLPQLKVVLKMFLTAPTQCVGTVGRTQH